jgi:uncharacterized protein YjiS (DUF1127 family)
MREFILHQAESHDGTFALASVRRVLTNWWKRRTLRQLQELDDHLLFDIGLSREELETALRLPLNVDASWEFSRRTRGVKYG